MNSSISTSELRRWRRLLRRYVFLTAALGLAAAALLVLLDPYDTGRLTPLDRHQVAAFGPRLTAASLARDPALQAAIVGNSTSELLDPNRLTALTGLRFVSLAIQGTGPVEQLAVARWLVRHHGAGSGHSLKALAIGLDLTWCVGNRQFAPLNPFPFWLYSDSGLAYAAHLVDLKAFEAAERSLKVMLGLEAPAARDGYRDYDKGKTWSGLDEARLVAAPDPPQQPEDFIAPDRLRDFLAEGPAATRVALVFLPRHYRSLWPAGSQGAANENLCKQRFREVAAARSGTLLVDLLTDAPIVRDDRNFWDRVHYRAPVARFVEAAIAKALRQLGEPRQTSATGG